MSTTITNPRQDTPWGQPDSVTDIGAGIVFVETPSHGGYYVPPVLNALIPLAWRQASFKRQAMAGWYEEDCDWCMVALAFPTTFPADAAENARKTFDYCIAPKLAGEPRRAGMGR